MHFKLMPEGMPQIVKDTVRPFGNCKHKFEQFVHILSSSFSTTLDPVSAMTIGETQIQSFKKPTSRNQ